MDDHNMAFQDFQCYITNNQQNLQVHLQAGNLLMLTGNYQEAIRSFQASIDLKNTVEAIYQKAKCFLLTNDLDQCSKCLKMLLTIDKNNTDARFDYEFMKVIKII